MTDETPIPLGDGKFAVAIDHPTTVDELRNAVCVRLEQGQGIYPQGGCTSLNHGGVPSQPGVVISTTDLNRIIDYPYEDMTITVEAGTTLAEIDRVLSEHNQRLCLDAPESSRATIGGIYATNWTGPKRYGHGRPRDQIIGVSAIDGHGELIHGGGRVVKNVAGYDFPKLMTGSMGTLGIIAEITLKVRPRPEVREFLLVGMEQKNLEKALTTLNTSRSRPVAIDLVCDSSASLIGGFSSGIWTLCLGLEGTAETVAWERERVIEELRPFVAEPDSVSVRQGHEAQAVHDRLVSTARPDHRLGIQANIRPSTVAEFVGQLDQGTWSIQAHAGSGIVHAYLNPGHDPESRLIELQRLRTLAVESGGTMTIPLCPTEWKSRLKVWGDPRSDWPLMGRIQGAFDPKGLMNSGRLSVS